MIVIVSCSVLVCLVIVKTKKVIEVALTNHFPVLQYLKLKSFNFQVSFPSRLLNLKIKKKSEVDDYLKRASQSQSVKCTIQSRQELRLVRERSFHELQSRKRQITLTYLSRQHGVNFL